MIHWLKSRLSERSTLIGIGTAIAAASVLPDPWNWLSLGVGTLAALIPDGKVGGA